MRKYNKKDFKKDDEVFLVAVGDLNKNRKRIQPAKVDSVGRKYLTVLLQGTTEIRFDMENSFFQDADSYYLEHILFRTKKEAEEVFLVQQMLPDVRKKLERMSPRFTSYETIKKVHDVLEDNRETLMLDLMYDMLPCKPYDEKTNTVNTYWTDGNRIFCKEKDVLQVMTEFCNQLLSGSDVKLEVENMISDSGFYYTYMSAK